MDQIPVHQAKMSAKEIAQAAQPSLKNDPCTFDKMNFRKDIGFDLI